MLASILHFDRASIAWGPAIRAALGLTAVLAAGTALSDPAFAAAAGVGALLAGYPSLGTGGKRPIPTMVGTTAGMALATFVGSASGSLGWAHVALLALWAFTGGLLVAEGDAAATVGTQATIVFIVFGRFAEPPGDAARLAGEVAVGGAVQILFTALGRFAPGLSVPRRAVADAYLALARLARSVARSTGTEAGAALDAAENALPSPAGLTPSGRRDVSALRSLVDEGRRLRISILALGTLDEREVHDRDRGGRADRAPDHWSEQVASVLRATASSIRGRGASSSSVAPLALPPPAHPASPTEPRGSDSMMGPGGSQRFGVELDALEGQLRAVTALAGTLAEPSLKSSFEEPADSLGRSKPPSLLAQMLGVVATLRASLTLQSTACRHALRLSAVVTVAEIVGRVVPLQRGYWVAVTAALVLRPDFAATMVRGGGRLVGTIVGAGVFGLLSVVVHPSGAAVVATIAVLAVVTYVTFPANYAAFSAAVTGLIILLISLVSPENSGLAVARLLDTLLGGAIAMSAYVLWPTWSRRDAQRALAEIFEAEHAYLDAVIRSRVASGPGQEAADTALPSLARRVRLARSNADAVVARSLAEPSGHRVDGGRAAGLLAAGRRLNRATHVVRVAVPPGSVPDLPELDQLVHELGLALDQLARAVATWRTTGPLPPLRALHDDLERAVSAGSEPGRLEPSRETSVLLSETDEMVDATDTAAAVLHGLGPS